MSKGLELELYFAIGSETRHYKHEVAHIKTPLGLILRLTIDHNVNKEPIIELVSDPVRKRDSKEHDIHLAKYITAVVDVLHKTINDSSASTVEISIDEIKQSFASIHPDCEFNITDNNFKLDAQKSKKYLLENKKDMLAHLQVNFSVKSDDLFRPDLINYFGRIIDPKVRGFNVEQSIKQSWIKANNEVDQLSDDHRITPRKLRKLRGMLFAAYHFHDASTTAEQIPVFEANGYRYLQKHSDTNLENLGTKDLHGLFCKTSQFPKYLSDADKQTAQIDTHVLDTIQKLAGNPRIPGKQTNEDDPGETKTANEDLWRNLVYETRSYRVGTIFDLSTIESHVYEKLRRFSIECFPDSLIDLGKDLITAKKLKQSAEILLDIYYAVSPTQFLQLLELAKNQLSPDELNALIDRIKKELIQEKYRYQSVEMIDTNKKIITILYSDQSETEQNEILLNNTPRAVAEIIKGNNEAAKNHMRDATEKHNINDIFILCCDTGNFEMIQFLVNNYKDKLHPNLLFKNDKTPMYLLFERNNEEIIQYLFQEFADHRNALLFKTHYLAKLHHKVEIENELIHLCIEELKKENGVIPPYYFLNLIMDNYHLLEQLETYTPERLMPEQEPNRLATLEAEQKQDLHNRTTSQNNSAIPEETSNSWLIHISMQVLSGFMATLGCAAVAVAFIFLNAATFGTVGLVVAGLGVASTLSGLGLFAIDRLTTASVSAIPGESDEHESEEQKHSPLQSLINQFAKKECSLNDFKHRVMLLAHQGADLTQRGTENPEDTVLHHLLLNNTDGVNDREIAELVSLYKDNNLFAIPNGHGHLPLHSLLRRDPTITPDSVKKLIEIEKVLHLKGSNGETLLHAASFSGNIEVAKYLMSQGLSINDLTINNQTMLHLSFSHTNVAYWNWLKENQIDINAQTNSGLTALHVAAITKNQDMTSWLIKNGANPALKDKKGKTSVDYSERKEGRNLHTFDAREVVQKKIRTFLETEISAISKRLNTLNMLHPANVDEGKKYKSEMQSIHNQIEDLYSLVLRYESRIGSTLLQKNIKQLQESEARIFLNQAQEFISCNAKMFTSFRKNATIFPSDDKSVTQPLLDEITQATQDNQFVAHKNNFIKKIIGYINNQQQLARLQLYGFFKFNPISCTDKLYMEQALRNEFIEENTAVRQSAEEGGRYSSYYRASFK